ncbi:MAG UNVERIFIED_CONTAM: hypothetical protein LVR18_34990 [Planctomycetaceae bacterium]|jgi:hypothetical protein
MSSSPIVVGGVLVVQVESDAEAFACGVDVITGETRWQIQRPRAANWTSPALYSWSGRPSSSGVVAVIEGFDGGGS